MNLAFSIVLVCVFFVLYFICKNCGERVRDRILCDLSESDDLMKTFNSPKRKISFWHWASLLCALCFFLSSIYFTVLIFKAV